jgi:hypothetical protein
MSAKGGAQKKPQAPRQITSLCSFRVPPLYGLISYFYDGMSG